MGALVTVAELQELLREPAPPVLLDSRWALGGPPGLETYRAGHIPGARYVDLDRDMAGPPGPGGRHPLPTADAFAAAMRAVGVDNDRAVVVYDDGPAVPAARLWWLLRWAGHDDVRVLNGGYRAWTAAGGATETGEPPEPSAGHFTAHPGQMPTLDASTAAALASTSTATRPAPVREASGPPEGAGPERAPAATGIERPAPDADGAAGRGRERRARVLLDVRSGERYRGEVEPIDPVAGHIPGARSAPGENTVTATGELRPAEELSDYYKSLGITPSTEVGAYCGSGVVAAREVLALEVAGIRATLYPGSWSEWVADPTRPVASGEEAD